MIGIVILNYNNWDDTIRCIKSIYETEKELDYHIYVVDNASKIPPSEECKNYLRGEKITFIQSKENNGYNAGNNIGIKAAIQDNCKEILISNNDVIYKKNSISKMKEFLDNNKNIGIVGPKIYRADGSLQKFSMGTRMGMKGKYLHILDKTIFSIFSKDFMRDYCAREKDLSTPFKVHAVFGCCFLISSECVKDITPFDENTFLYEEEKILGIKMEQLGYDTYYYPESEIIHLHGQSTKNIKAFSYMCLVESEMYYCKEYLKASIFAYLPLYIIRSLKFIFYAFKYSDFRNNLFFYFKRTLKKLLNYNKLGQPILLK